MNYNKFISYNIDHNEISRNNEKFFHIAEIFPIQSCEFKPSQISLLNSLKTSSLINKNEYSLFSSDIQKINLINKGRQILNLPIKDINNIKSNNTPHSIKVYKAMSYKNFLSKSIPKQLNNKIKIFIPNKIKNSIFESSRMYDSKENNNHLIYSLNKYNNRDIELFKE